jgi:hypothetical protein
MTKGNSKLLGCAVFICCATFLFCFSSQASGQEDGTSLMLEVSPSQGGYLNIVPGVYSYDRFAVVTLVATPKPGYQFVYWLGNVSDATTGTTMVFLDSPKMVIAVFARNKFETIGLGGLGGPEGLDGLYGDMSGGGSGGSDVSGSGLTRSGGESDSSLEQAAGGPKRSSPPHSPDFPVPVPVPEPVSAALFFAGFLMLARSRRNGANITEKM